MGYKKDARPNAATDEESAWADIKADFADLKLDLISEMTNGNDTQAIQTVFVRICFIEESFRQLRLNRTQ